MTALCAVGHLLLFLLGKLVSFFKFVEDQSSRLALEDCWWPVCFQLFFFGSICQTLQPKGGSSSPCGAQAFTEERGFWG